MKKKERKRIRRIKGRMQCGDCDGGNKSIIERVRQMIYLYMMMSMSPWTGMTCMGRFQSHAPARSMEASKGGRRRNIYIFLPSHFGRNMQRTINDQQCGGVWKEFCFIILY